MFFVLSSGRSGSKTIAHTLNQLPGCVCLHHPAPELVLEATEYFCDGRGRADIAAILRETRPPNRVRGTYGEANLQLSLFVPIIDEVFPDCRFIWLIRDGRESVASMYYRGWYDPVRGRSPAIWHRARLQGDRTGDFSPEEWSSMDRFQRCCWIWKKYNLVIESELASLDRARWMSVRLDRLKESVPQLARFLGVRNRRVLVEKHNVALQPVVHWVSWERAQRKQFDELCGADMDRWFPEWRTADGEWVRIDATPPDEPGAMLAAKRRLHAGAKRWARLFRRAWIRRAKL